jgi:hypothetical protein
MEGNIRSAHQVSIIFFPSVMIYVAESRGALKWQRNFMYHMNDLCLINVDSQEIFYSCQYHFDIIRILNSETYHRIYSLHLELQ